MIITLPYISTILCRGTWFPQVTNSKYVTTIYCIYSIIPYISYEDPVPLTTPTTDPYHISHNEVCTVFTHYLIIYYYC